jgi:DNA-binding transcriptional LysR family regulator
MPRDAYEVMDLKSLRCFFAVARRGSLTKAGIELGISEAAVSQRVRSLEEFLGAKLYEARGRQLRLTAAGERTARLAVSIFEEIDALASAVSGAPETDELTLASHDSALRYLLPDKVEAFCREHPLARLRLLARPVEETLRLVAANECDLGVIPERPVPADLSFRAVTTYPACLLLQKGHPLVRRGHADFHSLLREGMTGHYPLIVLEVQREDGRLQQAFEHLKLPFSVGLEVSTIDTLKHYVARGLGVGIIPGFAVTREDRLRFDVLTVPADLGGDTTYGVVVRRGKHRSPLLKSLLAALTSFDSGGIPEREPAANP